MFNSNNIFFLSKNHFSPTFSFFLSIRTTNTCVLLYVHVYATILYTAQLRVFVTRITEQNRTEQNGTERNETERNGTERNGTEQNRIY